MNATLQLVPRRAVAHRDPDPLWSHGAIDYARATDEFRYGALVVQRYHVDGYSAGYRDGSGDVRAYQTYMPERSGGGYRPALRGELLRAFGWTPGIFAPWELGPLCPALSARVTVPRIDIQQLMVLARAGALDAPIVSGNYVMTVDLARCGLKVMTFELAEVSPRALRAFDVAVEVILRHLPPTICALVDTIQLTAGFASDAQETTAGLFFMQGMRSRVELALLSGEQVFSLQSTLLHEIGHAMERGARHIERSWVLAMLLDGCNHYWDYALTSWREDFAVAVQTYHEYGAAAYRTHYPHRATMIEAIVAGAISPL